MHFMSKIGKEKRKNALKTEEKFASIKLGARLWLEIFSNFLFLYNLAHFFSFIYSNIKGTENFQPKYATILIVTNFSTIFQAVVYR